jgi:hypothetical protein
MRTFSRKVAEAKELKAMNVKSWMDALIYKLDNIGIQKGIITLNRKLNNNGHLMLHMKTLHKCWSRTLKYACSTCVKS